MIYDIAFAILIVLAGTPLAIMAGFALLGLGVLVIALMMIGAIALLEWVEGRKGGGQ